MVFTCEKCGTAFAKQQGLRAHTARKRPCDAKSDHQCPHCPKSYTRVDNLTRHIAVCREAMAVQYQKLQARMDAIEKKQSTAQHQTNTAIITNNTINNVTLTIAPWGTPLQLTDADVEAALASIPCLAGTPAMTEVVAALMELVKRSHQPEAARNVHLNPKRSDQALALTAAGWAALPLAEATTALFDGASARIAAPAICAAPVAAPRLQANPLRATLPMQYRADKEAAVALGLRPMEAHLANIAPGGPGPLLLMASAAQPSAAQPLVQPTHAERVKAVLKMHPLRCSASGALLVDWIVAASQAAGLSGRELFKALEAGTKDAELADAWRAAQRFTEEKMRPHAAMP
jgi:hypothetical protein